MTSQQKKVLIFLGFIFGSIAVFYVVFVIGFDLLSQMDYLKPFLPK
ncbi:MAG: hypothetical protein PHO91_02440 [Patescibacteria group bacterium]|nr:hypothetical protein [Patescibacteria group bacterium]